MATPALKLVPTSERTTGELIDLLEANRNARRKLEEQLKPLEGDYKELKAAIIERLDAEKSLKASSRHASVTISEVTVPVVKDLPKLLDHIKKHKLYHLFLSQPLTTPAWREAVGLKGGDLPGTETFIKRDLNHASIKS